MWLTITTTHPPASDIGYLLEKHPARVHDFELSGAVAHVFYPEVKGFDAATLIEVVEHLDADRVAAFERALFEFARPNAMHWARNARKLRCSGMQWERSLLAGRIPVKG